MARRKQPAKNVLEAYDIGLVTDYYTDLGAFMLGVVSRCMWGEKGNENTAPQRELYLGKNGDGQSVFLIFDSDDWLFKYRIGAGVSVEIADYDANPFVAMAPELLVAVHKLVSSVAEPSEALRAMDGYLLYVGGESDC